MKVHAISLLVALATGSMCASKEPLVWIVHAGRIYLMGGAIPFGDETQDQASQRVIVLG